jgi:uncharacterized spore protein YtfJ
MATQNPPALVDELLQRIGRTVGDGANVSTIFGKPIERDGITVIPVARARFGFGGGGGGAYDDEGGAGGGGGGGGVVSPVGYIEVRDGTAEFKRISTPVDLVALVVAGSLAALTLKRLLSD